MNRKAICFASLFFASGLAGHAAIVWTGGGGDSNFFTTANWDFSGSSFASGSFISGTAITDSMVINNASGISLNGNLIIGDAFTLNLNNANVLSSGTFGIDGVADAGDVFSNISLAGSSSLSVQYINIGINATVGGGSTLTLRGGGDPLNSQVEPSRVGLDPDGSLVFSASALEYTEHTAEIFNNLTGNSLAAASGDFSPNSGTTITAIPEPSAAALVGFAALAMLRRRRH